MDDERAKVNEAYATITELFDERAALIAERDRLRAALRDLVVELDNQVSGDGNERRFQAALSLARTFVYQTAALSPSPAPRAEAVGSVDE